MLLIGVPWYWIEARQGLNMRLTRAYLAVALAVYIIQCAKMEKIGWLYIPAFVIAVSAAISVVRYRQQITHRNAAREDDRRAYLDQLAEV